MAHMSSYKHNKHIRVWQNSQERKQLELSVVYNSLARKILPICSSHNETLSQTCRVLTYPVGCLKYFSAMKQNKFHRSCFSTLFVYKLEKKSTG